MKDKEVMEILTRCALLDADACQDCPFNGSACRAGVISEAYEFACRKRAEIKKLKLELKAMRGAANSYKAEVERLQNHIKNTLETLVKQCVELEVKTAKSEAIKGFAERLSAEMWDWLGNMTSDNNKLYIHSKIHSLADEMTEKDGDE